jgi:hypothetical protein
MLLQLGIAFHTLFDESNALMQDLPNYAAEPMGDGPNGRLVVQSRQQPAEYRLEVTAILPRCSMGRLIQYPPQIFVSLCRTAVVVLFGAFLLPGTSSYPGGQLRGGGKRLGLYAHFGNRLLRGIYSETRYFGQAGHRLFMYLFNNLTAVRRGMSIRNAATLKRFRLCWTMNPETIALQDEGLRENSEQTLQTFTPENAAKKGCT